MTEEAKDDWWETVTKQERLYKMRETDVSDLIFAQTQAVLTR